MSVEIRPAERKDVPLVLDFIKNLAVYERLSEECVATEELLERYLFGEEKVAGSLLAYEDGSPVGFALYFFSFSTFLAKPGIYLEDLFVLKEKRGRGYGKALLKYLAALAVEKDYGRLEWAVLDWNKLSIDFYDSLGARSMNEWITYRLEGESLESVASG